MRATVAHEKSDVDGRGVGRPKKLGQEQIDLLRRVALENPAASVDDIMRLFAEASGVTLARMTAYSYLNKAGVKRVRARKVKWQPQTQTNKKSYGYKAHHRDSGDDSRYPACLTGAEWKVVADLFETDGPGKPPKYPRRAMVNACAYVVRSGCAWRMLPKDFPPWEDVYAHFRRWTTKGLFEKMHDRLRAMWREREKRDPSPSAAVIDSQSVKTSPQGGPKGFDAGKKVKGRKRHLVVDTLGLLLAVSVHTANIQDRDGAAPVVAQAVEKYPSIKKLFVDGGYAGRCADGLREQHKIDVEVVRRPSIASAWTDGQLPLFTPPQSSFVILPKRWVVERTHSWIERPRRMAKDHDRRLDVSESWIWFTEARLLLRRLTAKLA